MFGEQFLHEEDTMLTTMDDEVLELCTNTVTNTPITRPATGFARITFSLKMSPAALPARKTSKVTPPPHPRSQKSSEEEETSLSPPTSWKAELSTSSEQMNK